MPYTVEMAVDEQSSQDSTLIDDDLVAALGFEPVTTVESSNGDADLADLPVDDVADVAIGDIARNGDHDGFGIDEVDGVATSAADGDVLVADATADVEDRGSFFEQEHTLDSVSTEDLVSTGDVSVDDVAESDLDDVPSVSDTDVEATALVDPVDLDSEADASDLADLEAGDIDANDLAASDLDVDDHEVIDLDEVNLSDLAVDDLSGEELPSQGFADADVQELADADSVFADATPVLDPPAFDDPIGLPATESVTPIDSGVLDLDAAEENIGTVAPVATGAAVAAASTSGRRRLRARKSRRVIRHIDPWSVLTFSVLFHMVVFAALLLSSVLVWNAAIASGMVENVESFIQELGDYETFEINADVMFRAAIVIAGMLTLASSVLVVLLTVVFNLISDLVGGIRVTVIEEETVRVPIDKKRSKA